MDIVMGLFGHLRELDFNEVIMVALTFIACSAYSQRGPRRGRRATPTNRLRGSKKQSKGFENAMNPRFASRVWLKRQERNLD